MEKNNPAGPRSFYEERIISGMIGFAQSTPVTICMIAYEGERYFPTKRGVRFSRNAVTPSR